VCLNIRIFGVKGVTNDIPNIVTNIMFFIIANIIMDESSAMNVHFHPHG
jgi:hypothetical protein